MSSTEAGLCWSGGGKLAKREEKGGGAVRLETSDVAVGREASEAGYWGGGGCGVAPGRWVERAMLSSSAAAGGDGAGGSSGAGPGPQRLSWLWLAVGSSGLSRASSTTRLEWLDPEDTERPRLGSCGADNLADVETVLGSVLCC